MKSSAQHLAAVPSTNERPFTIGRILLDSGKLTPEGIERVLQFQGKQGIRFGEAAQHLGLITNEDVNSVLAQQLNYSYLQRGKSPFPRELVTAYPPQGDEVEHLRNLCSQLHLRWFSQGKKALAVVAMNSGSGASLLTANLGVLFSQLGEPTLIIDANLRSPKQHEIFNLKAGRGLSDVLLGRAGNETIINVNAFPELSILCAGTATRHPHALVTRPSLNELVEQFSRQFNVILVDAPAYSSAGETLAIVSHIGGALVLVIKDKTRAEEVKSMHEQFSQLAIEVAGCVMVEC